MATEAIETESDLSSGAKEPWMEPSGFCLPLFQRLSTIWNRCPETLSMQISPQHNPYFFHSDSYWEWHSISKYASVLPFQISSSRQGGGGKGGAVCPGKPQLPASSGPHLICWGRSLGDFTSLHIYWKSITDEALEAQGALHFPASQLCWWWKQLPPRSLSFPGSGTVWVGAVDF